MYQSFVIPTRAERRGADSRDLFMCVGDKTRSLDYAALVVRFAPG